MRKPGGSDLVQRYASHRLPGENYVFRDLPGTLIRRLHQRVVAQLNLTLADKDLTPVQYAVMAAVCGHPNSEQSRIADIVQYDRATVGSVLIRLEDKGLIERGFSENDRRVRLLNITATGRRVLRECAMGILQVQEIVLQRLDEPERAQFVQMLAKLLEIEDRSAR